MNLPTYRQYLVLSNKINTKHPDKENIILFAVGGNKYFAISKCANKIKYSNIPGLKYKKIKVASKQLALLLNKNQFELLTKNLVKNQQILVLEPKLLKPLAEDIKSFYTE